MTGDLLHLSALKGIAAATGASPAPKVFSAVKGLETFSTQYFVEWIDRLIHMCETKGVYSSDADRASVVALFRDGQAYYRQLAGQHTK